MSLRQQLQDPGKKPVSYQHFINKDKDKDKDLSQGGAASRHVSFSFLHENRHANFPVNKLGRFVPPLPYKY